MEKKKTNEMEMAEKENQKAQEDKEEGFRLNAKRNL